MQIAIIRKLWLVTNIFNWPIFMYCLDILCLIRGTLRTVAVKKLTMYLDLDFYVITFLSPATLTLQKPLFCLHKFRVGWQCQTEKKRRAPSADAIQKVKEKSPLNSWYLQISHMYFKSTALLLQDIIPYSLYTCPVEQFWKEKNIVQHMTLQLVALWY